MEIENEMKRIIEEAVCGKYIGKLGVEVEEIANEDPLWMLMLYLDLERTPLVIACQGTLEKFKNVVKKEIKARKLQMVEFWTATKEIPSDKKKCDG